MILVNHNKKKAFIIEPVFFNGFYIQKYVFASEDKKDKYHDEIFYAAQELNYPLLNKEDRAVAILESGYCFSFEERKELYAINSEQAFKDKFFPEYEIIENSYAEENYFFSDK